MVLARPTAVACALAVAAALGSAACGKPSKEAGLEEPAREGLAIPVGTGDVEYNVFITRQLNLRIVPDKAYYRGPAPSKDDTLYGVFLQVCNHGTEPQPTADSFKITDNQGNEFEPVELPEDNEFAYRPKTLPSRECIPEAGSVAQLGPTAGSMLLFELPLDTTEIRPLELEIESPTDDETRKIELDL
jgi:hypothetical protein